MPDNEKIAVNFNKSELKLILNCISKERPAPVRIDRGLFGYDIVCSHCSSMLKKLPIYDKKDFLAVLEDSSYYLGKHCRYCVPEWAVKAFEEGILYFDALTPDTPPIGSYVIQGVRGEIYCCKEDIFLETYESVLERE